MGISLHVATLSLGIYNNGHYAWIYIAQLCGNSLGPLYVKRGI
jgi:hypothetical protein